jgi:hypothetical protein
MPRSGRSGEKLRYIRNKSPQADCCVSDEKRPLRFAWKGGTLGNLGSDMTWLFRIARPASWMACIPAVAVGLASGNEDLGLALLAIAVPFFIVRAAILMVGAERRVSLERADTDRWVGDHYLAATVGGGIQALIFGAWVAWFAVMGIAGL